MSSINSLPHCQSEALSHIGKVRRLNEDAVLSRPSLGLWAVADGMGGETAGDLASRSVVEALADIGETEEIEGSEGLLKLVCERLGRVNQALLREASGRGPNTTIATTVVVLILNAEEYFCLWAGDSRMYILRGGELTLLSHDHSYAQQLVDKGLISPEEAEIHPHANVVTQAVGANRELALELCRQPWRPGDRFLLCSDGLNGSLPNRVIASVLGHGTVEEAAQRLIDLSLEAGARDNVSVVVVDVPS